MAEQGDMHAPMAALDKRMADGFAAIHARLGDQAQAIHSRLDDLAGDAMRARSDDQREVTQEGSVP
jgi:hypothetical protein